MSAAAGIARAGEVWAVGAAQVDLDQRGGRRSGGLGDQGSRQRVAADGGPACGGDLGRQLGDLGRVLGDRERRGARLGQRSGDRSASSGLPAGSRIASSTGAYEDMSWSASSTAAARSSLARCAIWARSPDPFAPTGCPRPSRAVRPPAPPPPRRSIPRRAPGRGAPRSRAAVRAVDPPVLPWRDGRTSTRSRLPPSCWVTNRSRVPARRLLIVEEGFVSNRAVDRLRERFNGCSTASTRPASSPTR